MIRLIAAPGAGVVAAVIAGAGSHPDYSNTITLGSIIIGLFVAIGTIVTMAYGAKWKAVARTAIARGDELDKYLDDEKQRHEQASRERKELAILVADQKTTIARLEALPNLSAIIEQMAQEATRSDDRAVERMRESNADARARLAEALQDIREMNEDLWAQHEAHANRRTAELKEAVMATLRATERTEKVVDEMEDKMDKDN